MARLKKSSCQLMKILLVAVIIVTLIYNSTSKCTYIYYYF